MRFRIATLALGVIGLVIVLLSPGRGWSVTVKTYYYYVYDNGIYFQTYLHPGQWKYYYDYEDTDTRYDDPYELSHETTDHENKTDYLAAVKSAIGYTQYVNNLVQKLKNMHFAQLSQTIQLDSQLSAIYSYLKYLNSKSAAKNEQYGDQIEAQMRTRIGAWKDAVDRVIEDYKRQQQPPAPNPPSGSAQVAMPIPEIQGGNDPIKPSAYDYDLCADARGYYGYWVGQNFVSASYDDPVCQAGRCRCEYIVP